MPFDQIVVGVLATSRTPADVILDVLPWSGLLVGLAVVGWIVIVVVRRSLGGSGRTMPTGFTLDDLRRMHAAGDLSDEEFSRAKARLIGSLSASDDEEEGPSDALQNTESTGKTDRGAE